MSRKHPWEDKEKLRQKYCVDGDSIQEIADDWDTTYSTIRYYKDKFDLEGRPMNVSPEAHALTEEDLRREYWDNGKSLKDMADEYNCSQTYILRKMEENNVPRDKPDQEKVDKKYKNADWLRYQYWDLGKTLEEMGRVMGCTAGAVSNIMESEGVEREKIPEEMPPNHRFTHDGYERVRTKVHGKQKSVSVHQLIAIANGADPHKVFSGGEWHVHHENGVPWDNRPENLELVTESEHHTIHYEEMDIDDQGRIV